MGQYFKMFVDQKASAKFNLQDVMRPPHRSILPLTSALDGNGLSTPRPGHFTPVKTCYPLTRRHVGTENLAPLDFDPRTVHPIAIL
jgi:hypothetical protein